MKDRAKERKKDRDKDKPRDRTHALLLSSMNLDTHIEYDERMASKAALAAACVPIRFGVCELAYAPVILIVILIDLAVSHTALVAISQTRQSQ